MVLDREIAQRNSELKGKYREFENLSRENYESARTRELFRSGLIIHSAILGPRNILKKVGKDKKKILELSVSEEITIIDIHIYLQLQVKGNTLTVNIGQILKSKAVFNPCADEKLPDLLL